ncbi:MAG: OmpA family protein, partial [Arenimonas sp.]
VVGTLAQADAEAASDFAAITAGRKYFRGTLVRVEPGVVPISVLVNGKPTRLDTIHAKGVLTVGSDSVDMEFWVLDDPLNPLVLRGRQGRNFGQTIRLDFPVAKPKVAQLQAALAGGACRTDLSGIYFDFAKATLLPQSAGALRAVADTMKANPGWTLRIEGHTDNVGTAAFNLDLSQRRAAAVREALIAQFKVPAARLAANGFGASKPVASNTSLDGRAANRRVELARTCP